MPYLPDQLEYLLDLLILEAMMVMGMLIAVNLVISKDLSSDMWQCIRGKQNVVNSVTDSVIWSNVFIA